MSARPFRPLRWIAGGSGALIVTIWVALMLGLNAPSARSVPVAPWAEGGYGADAPATLAADDARLSPAHAPPLRPAPPSARVGGVRVPAAPAAPPAGPAAVVPPPADSSDPAPLVPPVPALPAVPTAVPAPDLPLLPEGSDA